MRKFFFLALAALMTLLVACKSEPAATKHGHRFVNHTKKSGEKSDYGQTVEVNVYTFLKDSLIQSTMRDMGGPQMLTLPDSNAFKKKFPAVFDVLLEMTEGDSATVYMEVDSAMAAGIKNTLPEFADVKEIRYEVVLINQFSKEELAAKEEEERKLMEEEQKNAEATRALGIEVGNTVKSTLADYKAGKLGDRLKKTASGLEYVVLQEGSGPNIKNGEKVSTHYYGVLKSTGQMFDNSFDRGMSVPFVAGQLIPGFNEGMMVLNRGSKAILFIPSKLGYGAQGAGEQIPPNADLVFYIEMKQ